MAYSEWLTVSLQIELERLRTELSRALKRLSTLRKEYDAKWVELRKAVARIRYWQRRIKEAEAEVKRARKKTVARLRRAREELADVRISITPHLATREEVIDDINYERDDLLRPLQSRIATLKRSIREIEEELERRKRTVTVRSQPISVAFTYDGIGAVTPVSFMVYRDESVTFYMPDIAIFEGEEYRFKRWEDGSTNPTRTVTVVTDVAVTAFYEVPVPVGYVLREYTAYLEYPEYKATAHSPPVRFEARGVFTIPSDLDPEDDHVRDVIQAKLVAAIVEISAVRTYVDPETREVITEAVAPTINPDAFDQGLTVGTEDVGTADVFAESVPVDIVKYVKMREIQRWKTTTYIREEELRG